MKPRTSYGPEAIVLVLAAAGGVGLGFTLPVTAAIAVLLAVLVASYRQVIAAFPNGGGAYAVARRRLGDRAALTDHGLAQRLSPGDPRRESAGKVVDVVDDVPGAGHPLVDDGYVARAKSGRLLTQSQIIDSFVRVPALSTLLAVLIGGALLGLVGALVAAPNLAALHLLAQEVLSPQLDRA